MIFYNRSSVSNSRIQYTVFSIEYPVSDIRYPVSMRSGDVRQISVQWRFIGPRIAFSDLYSASRHVSRLSLVPTSTFWTVDGTCRIRCTDWQHNLSVFIRIPHRTGERRSVNRRTPRFVAAQNISVFLEKLKDSYPTDGDLRVDHQRAIYCPI